MTQVSSERACDRCRERRVKCDKRHPSCLRCEKFGKPCPGYDKKRKFVDEGETLRKKYQADCLSDTASQANTPNEVVSVSPANRGGAHVQPESGDDPIRVTLPLHPAHNLNVATSANKRRISRPTEISAGPPLHSIADASSVDDALIDDAFDPEWFNIDPAEYYRRGANSCGFIPNPPNIVDEVDRRNSQAQHNAESSTNTPRTGSLASVVENNVWAPESQLQTSAIIVDEREREVAFLIRHFTECIGPWMDLFDLGCHFAHIVPLKALRDALLRNAIAAVAAKQLGRVCGSKPYQRTEHQQPAAMEVLEDHGEIDWFYKAANYYDKAISFSRVYLGVVSGNLREALTPTSQFTMAVANSNDLLAAVSIFSLYESLDRLDSGWLQHLSGMKSLLAAADRKDRGSLLATVPEARAAAFWNFTRADYQAAYLYRKSTLLDTGDLPLWRLYGLQVSSDGSLYSDPVGVKNMDTHAQAGVELVCHTLIWLLLCIINHIYGDAMAGTQARRTKHDLLTKQLDDWHLHLPAMFQPCAQVRHRGNRKVRPDEHVRIKEVFFSIKPCAAAMQLYHFARILLLLNNPDPEIGIGRLQAYRQVIGSANAHAQAIIGIALARPHPAVRVEMLLPLHMSGMCLEDDVQREIVLELLQAIEKDTGYSSQGRTQSLLTEWGWSRETMGR